MHRGSDIWVTLVYSNSESCSRARYVMEFLGHRSLQHTRKYVQLERAMFHSTDDSFICKVAGTTDEATELIELGFEYVNEINGRHLYR